MNGFAQKWPWVVKNNVGSQYLDVAIGYNGQIATLYKSYEGAVFLEIADTSGNSIDTKCITSEFQNGERAFQMEIDKFGNIYVITRKTIRNQKLFDNEFDDEAGHHGSFQVLQDDPYGEYHDYIQLEKYSSTLVLLKTLKLLKLSEIYKTEIADFVIDKNGDFLFAGTTSDEDYFLRDEEIKSKESSDFIMKLDSSMSTILWMKSFSGDASRGSITSMHMAVNKFGNVFLSNTFGSVVHIGETTYNNDSKGKSKIYVLCLSKDGNVLWSNYMGMNSYDTDAAALSSGDFVLAGTFNDVVSKGPLNPPQGKLSGMFVMTLDRNNGRQKKTFMEDTSTIQNLCPGIDNDFYCVFNYQNTSYKYTISHFNDQLIPNRLCAAIVDAPLITLYQNSLYFAGSWGNSAFFGDYPERQVILSADGSVTGDYGGYLTKMIILKK